MKVSALEFASTIDQQITALSREELLLRKGRAKRLQEELYPISRFALTLLHPGVSVEIEAFENDGPIDAIIRFNNSDLRQLRIEATYVYSHEAALRNELLWKTGSTPGGGSIYRNKLSGEIVAINELISTSEEIGQLANGIINLHSKKCTKKYPPYTILLIAFEEPSFFWSKSLASTL
jgi:hypothetical protein